MKAGMPLRTLVSITDVYSLLAFFAGTTVALFNKKYYLFDGFHPILYAALFGFMISLAFKCLWKNNYTISRLKRKPVIKHYAILSVLVGLSIIALLALALFTVWYLNRLQGLIVMDNVNYWPNALLLCLCLGICYSFYSFMEERYLRKLFY
jgi:membrane protease YdiL (CAAX protease family)